MRTLSIVLSLAFILAAAAVTNASPPCSGGPCGQTTGTGNPAGMGHGGGGPGGIGPRVDGTDCLTGGAWNQKGEWHNDICEPKHGLLIHGADDKFGGDGLGYATINEWVDIGEDDVTGGPMFAAVGSQSSSHSWFDAQYDALGVGMRSVVYTNEKVEFDYKSKIGGNPGGSCPTKDDPRGTELLTYVGSFGSAPPYTHVEASSSPAVNDDVLHAIGSPAPAASISAGDNDGGRIVGATSACPSHSPAVTVEKYVMNPDSTDVQNLTFDYWSGKIGDSGSRTYVSPSVPGINFWAGPSPTPGPNPSTNPNGDASNPLPGYDASPVGAFSCYDIMYSDVSGLTYNRGQSTITWNGSYELDQSYPTGDPWDWNNSFPGLLKAELDWANSLSKPSGIGNSRCNDGNPWKIWSNGFANPGGTIANDTNHTWAWNQSCDGDQMGGNIFGSNEGTATDMLGGDEENSWFDNNTGLPYPAAWAINVNCATDVLAEGARAFVQVGGHPGLHDLTYDGYDMSTTITQIVHPSASPQVVTVGGGITGNDSINGNDLGQKMFALMVVDPTNGNEIVPSAGQSGHTTLNAIFLLMHGSGVVLRTLSPESARITTTALSYMVQQDGKTVVQASWWNTSQGNSNANHYDVGAYPEQMLHGQWLRTAPYFIGNPVYTKLTATATCGVPPCTLTFQADGSPPPTAQCTTACWNGTRDMSVGQTLSLFDTGGSAHLESVAVSSIDSSTQIHISGTLVFTHAVGSILRGSQGFDGCQKLPDNTYAADQSTTGGIGFYLVGGTCGEDGVALGQNPHRPGGVFCREANNGTYLAAGPVFNWAVCVNTTNKSVAINALYSGGGCSSNCLTQSYAHYCGALVLNGNGVDDSCLGRNPPVNTTGILNVSTSVFTAGSTNGVRVGGLYLLDSGANLETVCVAPGTAVTLGTSVNGGTCQAGGFAFTHTGSVPLTSASGTIQLDGTSNPDGGYDGGGGTICGYGGPYNIAGDNPSPAPHTSFSTTNCPALTGTSSTDSSDAIAPGTGVFFLQ